MAKELTPQFSRKVFLVSLIFLLANLGLFGLRYLIKDIDILRPVSPKLVSARIAEIEVKSPYDDEYRRAQANLEIFTGTSVRTGEAEFAELVLESNIIRMDEQTEIKLLKNNFPENGPFVPDTPRLEIELISGSIWVDAFDLIQVHTPRSLARLSKSVGIITYSNPINRLMVVTGAADLHLLGAEGELLSDFVVPLHNQVTFVDHQITATYAALKASKLKKELKMTPISSEVLADEWVRRNANDFEVSRGAFKNDLITSDMTYKIRSFYGKMLSYITFIPEARRHLAVQRSKVVLAYLLGAVQDNRDMKKAEILIEDFEKLVSQRKNDPRVAKLIVETLFSIEYSRSGTPAYLLKDYLIDEILIKEGAGIFRIYLTDLRRALYEKDVQASEIVVSKWLTRWQNHVKGTDTNEFERQSQMLNHTILSHIEMVTPALLDVFDESGKIKMAFAEDLEEARFEIISDRLQITASLISSYRYALAKRYLKNSYLSLDIENLSPSLASTQIFLENGKLLAQRIEYAENVLRSAAEPIDETRFFNYFQTLKRDEALSADLRKFFELDQEVTAVETDRLMPTAAEVAERFLDARINVNYVDISRQSSSGYYYTIINARPIARGPNNEAISFNAAYDYVTNSVTDVVAGDTVYKESFTLEDIVTILRTGGQLESRIAAPKLEEGIELLITDRQKIEALEGQAIAQDIARQLAYNQLQSQGIMIPEAKFNIEILDELNLNKFQIKNALIPRSDGENAIKISFEYHSVPGEAINVIGEDERLLLSRTPVSDLAVQVLGAKLKAERESAIITEFMAYTKVNNLYIDSQDISYTNQGLLSLNDLELLGLELRVSGLLSPETKVFQSVTHPLLNGQNVELKEYFESLADQRVISYLQQYGFLPGPENIETVYPFDRINIRQLNIEGYIFSFELDMKNNRAIRIAREGVNAVIPELGLEALEGLPSQIRSEEAAAQEAALQEAVLQEEEAE